jgi:hypothetical protein
MTTHAGGRFAPRPAHRCRKSGPFQTPGCNASMRTANPESGPVGGEAPRCALPYTRSARKDPQIQSLSRSSLAIGDGPTAPVARAVDGVKGHASASANNIASLARNASPGSRGPRVTLTISSVLSRSVRSTSSGSLTQPTRRRPPGPGAGSVASHDAHGAAAGAGR